MFRLILAVLCCSTAILAQYTAVFPGAVATDANLGVVSYRASSTLTAGIDASQTTLTVQSGHGSLFAVNNFVIVDTEKMRITGISTDTLTVVRNFANTTAASHSSGANIVNATLPDYHNRVAAELKATQANVIVAPSSAVTGNLFSAANTTGKLATATGLVVDSLNNLRIPVHAGTMATGEHRIHSGPDAAAVHAELQTAYPDSDHMFVTLNQTNKIVGTRVINQNSTAGAAVLGFSARAMNSPTSGNTAIAAALEGDMWCNPSGTATQDFCVGTWTQANNVGATKIVNGVAHLIDSPTNSGGGFAANYGLYIKAQRFGFTDFGYALKTENGIVDFGGADVLITPTFAAAAPTTDGQMAYNTTDDTLRIGNSGTSKTVVSLTGPCTDGQIAKKVSGVWACASDATATGGTAASDITFTQAGTGANATTADEIFKRTLNVKEFGALCDGTTNDTTSINEGIAAAAAAGKVLYTSDGVCVHTPIVISSPVHIELAPKATWRLQASSTGKQLEISASNVTIRGGTLDGLSASNPSGTQGVFVNAGFSDITIDGVIFLNHKTSNLQVKGGTGALTTRVKIMNSTFNGAGDHAVFFNWECADCEISRNKFLLGTGNAIWAGNGSLGLKVEDNLISGYTRMGIEIWRAGTSGLGWRDSKAQVMRNRITNNGTGADAFGISISEAGGCVVDGNVINLTAPAVGSIGLELIISDKCSVQNNQIYNAGIGITVDQTSDTVISSNQVHSFNGVAGIFMAASVASASVSRNTLSMNRINITQTTGNPIGIWIQANSASVVIDDNNLIGNIITGQNTTSGTGILFQQDTGTLSRNILSLNNIKTVQNAIVRDADISTTLLFNIISGTSTVVTGTGGTAAPSIQSGVVTGIVGSNKASASTVTLDDTGELIHVTGTTSITTLNTCNATYSGRRITLIFDAGLTMTDGNNMKLASNFITTADDTMVLICDGTNWFELSRSVN